VGTGEGTFRRKRGEFICRQLNIFANAQDAPFIDYEVLKKNMDAIDERSLEARYAMAGSTFRRPRELHQRVPPVPAGRRQILHPVPHLGAGGKGAKGNENLDFYSLQMQGLMTICPEATLTRRGCWSGFTGARERYDVVSIGYDPANAPFFVRRLRRKG
jgi:phage terminase large subunit-like protein